MIVDVAADAPSGSRRRIGSWAGFLLRFVRMAGPFWRAAGEREAIWFAAALAVLTCLQVAVPVALNIWTERLFDSLAQRDLRAFLLLLVALAGIISGNVAVVTVHLIVKRRIQVRWRDWLTRRVMEEWMAAGRHYQVTYMPGEHENPDGRIAEDVRIATEDAVDLAHSLTYVLLLGASFWAILWRLSGDLDFSLAGAELSLPGHLVWAAIAYSAFGMVAALLVGRPLIAATDRRQNFEADFRFGLAQARESSPAIALAHGETDERRRLSMLFGGVVEAWNRQTAAFAKIFLYSSSWSVLTQVFPVLVAAPRYIAGAITLGVLMQTAQAMLQFISALSWPIDNLSKLAEWRASAERVAGLRDAIGRLSDEVALVDGHGILVAESERPMLRIRNLSVADRRGDILIHPFSMDIVKGERVALCGEPGAAAKLFEVVAGLWPWGHGQVALPQHGAIFFMPQRPYLPMGPLGHAVEYPAPAGTFGPDAVAAALRRAGLGDVVARLDEAARWERRLSASERQRVGFARLLLHRPDWVFVDEAANALDPRGRADMAKLVQDEFAQAALIAVGVDPILGPRPSRRLLLERSDGAVAVREAPADP